MKRFRSSTPSPNQMEESSDLEDQSSKEDSQEATRESSTDRSGSSSAGQIQRDLQFARIIRDDAEQRYLEQHAAVMENASETDRRRIRRDAKRAGSDAYIAALEKAITTTEEEKQALLMIIASCMQDTNRASNQDGRSGSNN